MEKYLKCTTREFKRDISELCDKCPLMEKIVSSIEDYTIPVALDQKAILSKEQFEKYVIDEIEKSQKGMIKVFQYDRKFGANDGARPGRISLYLKHKENIKALNGFNLSNKSNEKQVINISQKKISDNMNELNSKQATESIEDTPFHLTSVFDNSIKETPQYNNIKDWIDKKGYYETKSELGHLVKFYNPVLATVLLANKMLTVNTETGLECTINPYEYLLVYNEGFNKGISFFEKKYNISPDTIYGQNSINYIKDLHSNYFHIKHYKILQGWIFIKMVYPFFLIRKEISQYGYFAGIISKVHELTSKYPNQFEGFYDCKNNLFCDEGTKLEGGKIEDYAEGLIEQTTKQKEPAQTVKSDSPNAEIEEYLSQFEENISSEDFKILVSALSEYFVTGSFPKIEKQIKIKGRVNKKKFGWTLYEIFKNQLNDKLSVDYLKFAKQNISLFTNDKFDENNHLKSNLYKYFTTNTQ